MAESCLERCDAQLALWNAMNDAAKFGDRDDDKLVIEALRQRGVCLAYLPVDASPAPAAPKEAQEPVATMEVKLSDEGPAYDVWLSNGMFALEPGVYPLYASPSQPQPGYVLLPVKPKGAIRERLLRALEDAGKSQWAGTVQGAAEHLYDALVAAASPQPQTGGGEGVKEDQRG